MVELTRSMHRILMRWQLRNLDVQAREIVEARRAALTRLVQIRREQRRKEGRLGDEQAN